MKASQILFVAGLLTLTAAALAIRLPRLDQRPMHGDEANQAVKAGILLEAGQLRSYDATDKVLPLYFGAGNATHTDGFTISATPTDPSGEWFTGTTMDIDVRWEAGRYVPGWHADIACYTLEGEKLFALQSHTLKGFDSSDPRARGIRFSVVNPGLLDRDLRLDIGVRPSEHQPYNVVVENALILRPSVRMIEHNRVPDVLLVPPARCTPITG